MTKSLQKQVICYETWKNFARKNHLLSNVFVKCQQKECRFSNFTIYASIIVPRYKIAFLRACKSTRWGMGVVYVPILTPSTYFLLKHRDKLRTIIKCTVFDICDNCCSIFVRQAGVIGGSGIWFSIFPCNCSVNRWCLRQKNNVQ